MSSDRKNGGRETLEDKNYEGEGNEDDAENLVKSITDGLKRRAKFYRVTKHFAVKEVIARRDLLLLETCVAGYEALKMIDKKLAVDHQSWMAVCGKTAEDLD